MQNNQKRAVFIGGFVVLLWSTVAFSQRLDCLVSVVDSEARAVSNAEVVVYELLTEWETDRETVKVLFSGKTDSAGRVEASIDYSNAWRVMIIVRKDGHALGWDVLPYNDFARPVCYIILDKPVSLTGQVIDHLGRAVANARVQAIAKTCKLERLEQSPVFGPAEWMTVQTDRSGRFQFDCFGEGVSADFQVTPPGSGTSCQFTPHPTASCGYEVGRKDICLALSQPVTIRGCVVDDQGKAVSGMTVVARKDFREANYFQQDYVPLSCRTDEQGRFAFEGLPAAGHFVGALNTDVARPWVDKTMIVNAADPNEREAVNIQLERGGILNISMREEKTAKAIQNALLYISKKPENKKGWWFGRYFVTGPAGSFSAMCPAGQCELYFWDERYPLREDLKLPLVEKGKTVEALFSLTPAPTVKGTVQNPDGSPAESVSVSVSLGQQVLADKNGGFESRCEQLRDEMFAVAWDIQNNRAAFGIIRDPREPIRLTLGVAKPLIGQVTDLKGRPVPAVRVGLSIRGVGCLSNCCPRVLTDAKGQFEFRTVPADLPEGFELRLSTETLHHGVLTYQKLDIENQTDTQIELKPIRMSAADQMLDGIVLDADGSPVALLPIIVQGKGQYQQTTTTDQNGRFQVTGLCDGEIRLQAGFGGEDFKPGRMTAHSGDTDVKIYMGQERVHVPEVTIQGKAIPGWEAIAFDKQPDLSGKRLLVCFWDYQQRPSRHAVSELAAMQEVLEKQSVQVVLIHAGMPDEKATAWLTKKQAGFNVGHCRKDDDALGRKWGVQSLPWVILTDAEHQVIAEGISVKRLAELLADG